MYKNPNPKNYTLFQKIDNEKSAYWLGYMYADGNVYKVKNQDNYITLLCSNDIEHLEKFKNDINAHQNIRNYKNYICYKISICSRQLGIDLINLGCIPKKSLILKFPTEEQVPKELIRHFIRGYFDGDGCVCHTVRSMDLNFLGTYDFIYALNNTLNKIINTSIRSNYKIGNIYRLTYNSKNDVLKLIDYLYSESSISLDRKILKADNLKKHLLSNKKITIGHRFNKKYNS